MTESEKVLIVDDEDDVREFAANFFRKISTVGFLPLLYKYVEYSSAKALRMSSTVLKIKLLVCIMGGETALK